MIDMYLNRAIEWFFTFQMTPAQFCGALGCIVVLTKFASAMYGKVR